MNSGEGLFGPLFYMDWYSKLARSGWLGTKAQVADQYGKPAWKQDSSDEDDPMKKAIKKVYLKSAQSNTGSEDSGA